MRRILLAFHLLAAALAALAPPRIARAEQDAASARPPPFLAAAAAETARVSPPSLDDPLRPPEPWLLPADAVRTKSPSAAARFLVPALETTGLVVVEVYANRYVGKASWAHVTLESIGRNLHSAWVLDDDQFSVNQFGHPVQAVFPYNAARSAGYGFWGSTVFVLASSTMWEIAGETEPPALNDQVTTVMAGAAFGEVLHRFTRSMRASGGGLRAIAAVLDPFGEINRHVLGEPPAEPQPTSSRATVAVGASAWTGGAETRTGSVRPLVAFRYQAGLPGDADLRLERPFDHFALETSLGGTGPVLRVRGLVAGRRFGRASQVRGLWGAFLSYDYDGAAVGYRTSTSAVGVGFTAVGDVGRGLQLESTAILSAVPIGAVGTMQDPRLMQRNYVFGPGAQGLLQVQLAAEDRVAVAMEFRQTGVVGVDRGHGRELMLEGRAGVHVRVHGVHGLAAEYTEYWRFADDPLAHVHARGDAVSLAYAFSPGRWAHAAW